VERDELDLDKDIGTIASEVLASLGSGVCATAGPDSWRIHAARVAQKVHNANFVGKPLTCRHLLTHTSGLQDDEAALLPGQWRVDREDFPQRLHQYVIYGFALAADTIH